jgi:hypothetical protein
MLVMLIVDVAVLVLVRIVSVLVQVTLGEVEPHSYRHEPSTH